MLSRKKLFINGDIADNYVKETFKTPSNHLGAIKFFMCEMGLFITIMIPFYGHFP